LLPLIA
jgi:ATP-binding cassette subfamily C (CFTR/MRP) protein 2